MKKGGNALFICKLPKIKVLERKIGRKFDTTGFLFGVRKMNLILLPKNFGIGESMGIFVLNIILGGIIGGVVLCFLIVKIFMELILVLLETFGQKVQK